MNTPFVSEEKSKDHLVLLVDRYNRFGSELASGVLSHATVVLVSEEKPQIEGIIHIPFTKRVPEIPEGKYSHIFLVAEETVEHDLLMPLAQKALSDNAKFVYVLPYSLYTHSVFEYLSQNNKKWVVVLLGDIFGGGRKEYIDFMLEEGKKKRIIPLPDLGLQTLRPVLYADAKDILLRIVFGFEGEGICFLFPRHPFTALSLTHALQKIDPLLRVDFVNKDTSVQQPLLPEGRYLLETEYPVLKKIQDEYLKVIVSKKSEVTTKPLYHEKSKRKKNWRLPVFSSLAGLVFFFLLPFLWVLVSVLGGFGFLASVKSELQKGNIQQSRTYAIASKTCFSWALATTKIIHFESLLVGQEHFAIALDDQLQAEYDLATAMQTGIDGAAALESVFRGTTKIPEITFLDGTNSLKNALLKLQQINQKNLPSIISVQLQQIRPITAILGQTVDVLGDIIGMHGAKTYVVLFQNNTELRPGGGFIGSYALVPLDKGKIGKITIHDVYDADGQLKGHVEPPFAIRRYIPLVHWYLRDSNFSADNLKNAQTAAFFLQQETGVKADGVISIDLDFVKELIAAAGKVYVPEYNETVTAENFYMLTQTHAEKNSFAGSSQKKDFLTALFSALQTTLVSSHGGYNTLITHMLEASSQKHILFAFSDGSIQQVFTVNNLSSTLWDPRKGGGNVLNDFTGVSEANIGVNKDNTFIKRTFDQTTTLYPTGTVSGVLRINYANRSDGSWPGGNYKNYLRVLLPNGAQITNIAINGVLQSRFPAVIDPKIYEATTFVPPHGLEIEHTQEGGREVYGFLMNVSVKSEANVSVSYALSQQLDLTQQISTYDILLFKQPGTEHDPYTFTFVYPASITLVSAPKNSLKTNGKVVITNPFVSDLDYHLTFSSHQ